ncbi:MAG: hypothetical protein LC130_08495 [Bryobacterales bacterium]|nr:hypothetical protein [Bryobacterales bacterium]
MPPGKGLEIPRLPLPCLDPFRPHAKYGGAFALAGNLLRAGIGSPEDWERCGADPVCFMLHTLERTAAAFDRRVIDSVAHTNIAFGTYPSASGWREPEGENSSRVFVAVEATHISIVYLRETLELLAKADPRLPATFYRMLLESISPWLLCYDETAAESYYEYRLESFEDAKASGEDEEGLEKPQSIEDTKGPLLSSKFHPWPAGRVPGVISSLRRNSRQRKILDAGAGLLALSRRRERQRPDWKVWEDCFPNGSYAVPFSIIAFHEQDLVCEAFQFDEEGWLNGGEEPSPAFFTVLDPNDVDSIRVAFEDLKHVLSMLEALGRLFALLPGADLLEVES